MSGDPSASDSNTWVAGDSLSRRTSGDDPDPVLERGRTLGRYVVLARLGSGGMGVVYAAYDPELDRKVALKLLHGAKDDAQPRLLREAQAMARLSHPSVVTVHDVGTVEGRIYVAMEFIDGVTLRDWLEREKRDAPFERRLEILRLAGEGLAAAHAQELVHRDFKPDNVMVGNDGRVRVLDFGLARATGETAEEVAIRQESADLSTSTSSKALSVDLTRTGAFLGTPRYMAPEQFEGRDSDARADQYAFAVTAWEVLYGKRPFSGDSAAAIGLARSIGKITPPPRSTDVPRFVRSVLERALAPDPANRYPSMTPLLEALAADPRRRRRRLAGVAVVLVGAAAAALGNQWHRAHLAQACVDEANAIDQLWNEDARGTVLERMMAADPSRASAQFDLVAPRLDAHAKAWSESKEQTCRERAGIATSDVAISRDLLAASDYCLEDAFIVFERFLAAVIERDAAPRIVVSAASFDPPQRCRDPVTLTRHPPPPEDAKAPVQEIRMALGTVQAKIRLKRWDEAVAAAEKAHEDAATIPWLPIRARTAKVLGDAYDGTGRAEDAVRLLREANLRTAMLGDPASVADVLLDLVFVEGVGLRDREASDQTSALLDKVLAENGLEQSLTAAHARSNQGAVMLQHGELERADELLGVALALYEAHVGDDHQEIAGVLVNLGNVRAQQERYDESLALYQRAIELDASIYGPDYPAIAYTQNNLGAAMTWAERHDDALAAHEAALAILAANYGEESPRLLETLMAVSAAHQHMGEDAAAIAAAERGLAIARKTGEPEDGEAWALVMIGQIALEANDLATATAKLQEALPLAKDTPERPGGRVEAGYYLARALWDFDPSRRVEAHDLVSRARERYAELEDTEWVEKMDAWLAEHPRPVSTP